MDTEGLRAKRKTWASCPLPCPAQAQQALTHAQASGTAQWTLQKGAVATLEPVSFQGFLVAGGEEAPPEEGRAQLWG